MQMLTHTQISIIIHFHYFHLHLRGYLLELYPNVAISDNALFLLLMDSLVEETGNVTNQKTVDDMEQGSQSRLKPGCYI